ncbi:hypothetical protein, conserved [Trypanosoma brucei gambiense DAL972]|uniref:SPRY domain-containing protein n=2 Tax=Trypanosoma brucei TaxID=5691 RepID=C9ZWT3_TRYB9|nr:hypothetical protein, conserved [Trypanosoma brucei gambiense DAL972]CBH13872.1 hypothetical protein, conserved [Trypanosoma brucei gambiense DAL972]|eukprot:XP_011776148.1 hypothetical protein, conserved [Trypanosoma brucei gambiense DAL972]
MSTPIGSRSRTHSIRRESAASLPHSTTCSSDSTSPPRAVPTDGTVMWSGSDRTMIGNEVAVGDVSACSGDSCKKSGGDRSFASYARGTSYVDCSGIGAVAKRSCVEEEAFQRGRIYLQQLESWKNLRVQALQEQPGSLACSRSASLRSLSTATRQEVVLFSPPRRQRQQQLLSTSPQLQQEATSPQPQPQPQLSPPPSPAKQAQPQLARPQLQQQSQSQSQSQSPQLSQPQRPFNSRRPGDSEWGGAHLLEKYYEGEVRRVAQRGQRLQEREWRLMERQLQDARAAETRAVEEARATAERVRGLEGQLHAAQQALAGVSASGREALEDLQLRDRQVEVLSIEVERLRMENMTIAVERRKVESLMKERVGELEAAAEASKQTEATLAARLQEAQYELSGHHQVLRERDEALCRESQSHQLVEERVAEMERQLKEATSLVDGERQEARRQAKRQAKALQQSQARCEELQRRYKQKERELTEQAERYEEILAARDASAASTTAQIEKEVDGYRRQYRELQQQLLQERVTMAAVAETQRAEVLRLRRTLNALQEELLLEAEDSRGSLAASRKHLQGELARGRQAEALLREASAEVARLRTTVADLRQKQHGSEGVLHDSPAQLSPKQKQTKKQRQKQRQRDDPPLPEDEPVPLPGDTTSLLLNECDDVNNDDRSTHHHGSYHCNGGGHNPQQFLFPCKKGDDGEERSPSVRNGTVPHAVDRPSSSLSRGEQENAQANGETAPSPEPSYTCTESATSDLVKCIEERLEPHLAALQTKVVDAVSALTSAGGYGVPEEQPQQPHDDKYQLTHLVNSPPTRRGTAPQVADAALTLGCVVKLLEAVSTLNVVLPYFESLSYQAAADGVLRGMDKRLVECLQQQQRLLRFAMQKIDEGRGQGGSPPASNVLSVSNVAVGDPLIPALTVALEERLETLLAMADLSNWAGASSDPATVSTRPQFEETGNASVSAEPMALRQVTPSPRDEDHALQQLGPAQSPLSPPRRSRTGDVRSRHTFGAVGGRLEVSESGAGIRRLPLPSVVDIISCSALGALNHKSFSMDHRAAPASALSSCSPPCFTYTIRAVAPCTNLLVGLSDAQLPLEVFSPALNSLSYPNCYFLHLGRGTLYCPRLSMADVPYPSFMCSGPILVDEEVTCVLDVAARTIRFVRSGVDCGVAFNDVEVSLPLCPAFEFDSSGGAIEFR